MLGPGKDTTGFEQGGISSGDFYKLYNNSQLKNAQSSCLGVDIGSSIVSAIGQADDVMLAANHVDNLNLLSKLTESYCRSYRVKLVSSKTKLLPMALPRHSALVEYAKVVNPVTIDSETVKFVHEAEHVGVLRSIYGNMPHILQRIAAHKKDLGAVSTAGMAMGHRGNPAASLKVHLLHATPVLYSGMATLVLTKAETKVLYTYYKRTIQSLQRLHRNTPRAVVFFLAGCLPGEAVLHIKQLGLFSMVCHLSENPLHSHARYILTTAPPSAKSWFQNIRDLCLQYGLPDPLQLLADPISKEAFKKEVKLKVVEYWQSLLRIEASPLSSLKYFKPELYSLTKAHYMWTAAASRPFECSKSTILSRMASGRYRTEMLCRHWNNNKAGHCKSPTCQQIPGTLEHLLVACQGLTETRERMYLMWLEKSVMFPVLHSTIREVLDCDEEQIVQFILEPLAFPQLLSAYKIHGQAFINQLSYLTRTYAFNIHREYQKLIDLPIGDPHLSTEIPDTSNSVYFAVQSLSQEDPTTMCQPSVCSQNCTAASPVQSSCSHLSTDHACQPSTDLVHHNDQDGGTQQYLPDQCLIMERSHASSVCVNPTLPSSAQNCTTSESTPPQTCVTDVQEINSDTTVQPVSPECQSVPSHGQAHGGTSGGGRPRWHDTQQSSCSLINIHHHPCSCTQ